MSLPAALEGKLRIPVIGAPMFIVSGPDLVIAHFEQAGDYSTQHHSGKGQQQYHCIEHDAVTIGMCKAFKVIKNTCNDQKKQGDNSQDVEYRN